MAAIRPSWFFKENISRTSVCC